MQCFDCEEKDYEIANRLCTDLLSDLGVSAGASVLDIIKTAYKRFPHETEINGDMLEGITERGEIVVFDYPSPNHKKKLQVRDVEWIRIEGYAGKGGEDYNGAYIMYTYLHLNEDRTAVDLNTIQFDYYPNPDTDDYVDSVCYRDCVK